MGLCMLLYLIYIHPKLQSRESVLSLCSPSKSPEKQTNSNFPGDGIILYKPALMYNSGCALWRSDLVFAVLCRGVDERAVSSEPDDAAGEPAERPRTGAHALQHPHPTHAE